MIIRKMMDGDLDGMMMTIMAGVTEVNNLANQTRDIAGTITNTRCGEAVAAVPGGMRGGS